MKNTILARDPAYIVRLGQIKPRRCDCGKVTWNERCRTCQRKWRREFKKLQVRYAAERNNI